jgi:hypothetical protein
MKERILTALDIDNNIKSIYKKLDEDVIFFNKARIRKKLKFLRDELKIKNENLPDDKKEELTKEEIQEIKDKISEDSESKRFRDAHEIDLKIKAKNLSVMRQTLMGLNELNEFSSEIERMGIQNIHNYFDFKDLMNQVSVNNKRLVEIIDIRKNNIDNFIKTFSKNKIIFDEIDLLLNIRDLYKINEDTDSIELYVKYNMDNNIDFSNRLGELYLKRYLEGDFATNIINEFAKDTILDNNGITKIIANNRILGLLLISGMSDSENEKTNQRLTFISNNSVTCYSNMWINNTNNKITYTTRTLGELLIQITNSDLVHVEKQYREQIYMTYDGLRPSSNDYHKWNGLQVYDIDLKEYEGNIEYLKLRLFDMLKEFHWFLWICKSASGKGIHIYTKVSPPHHVYINVADNERISKYWYNINYTHKVSIIYSMLYSLHIDKKNSVNFGELIDNYECKFLDNIVRRITAGIRLTYDKNPLVNNNFLDLHVCIGLCQTMKGWNYKDDITKVFFRNTKFNNEFQKTIYDLSFDLMQTDVSVMDAEKEKLNKTIMTLGIDLLELQALPRNKINYTSRFNVCNTLASLYGKDGLDIAHTLLDSKGCDNIKEINGMYACSLSNKKEISKIGIDILKKAGIIKVVEPEIKEKAQNNYKNYIKRLIDNSINKNFLSNSIELAANEYISDIKEQLLDPKTGIVNNRINLIFSPPNTGKTEFIKTLAREGKRILLVLPYISVIKNKIETDEEIGKLFQSYYGTKDIKKIEYGINAVTTFDKFSKANYERLSKMFDYIFIDESHLLFTSSYRIQATSMAVKKIEELFFISSNDPFAAKICLLTGTETGESYFFHKVANIIRINKKSLEKTMEFLICDDTTDCITRLANNAANLLKEGYKLLIPTNKGEIYSEKLIGIIEYLLERTPKYGYYKRSNTDQEICKLINNDNTIADYEIIFCSNYLSVGVDIIDKVKFASIYFGPFSGFEIEQFNARVRKSGMRSIYCIQTMKNDGYINDILLEEPNMVLRLTNDDIANFKDDKEISSAKQEFLAQYDPVLKRIVTPGFSQLAGKIMFNKEEYELIMFEDKYNECMQHPVRVARELSKYGYKISVSTDYEGLSEVKQQELKAIGLASARQEKIKKHNLLVGTFLDLVNKNTFINSHGLEYSNIIGWIGKNTNCIFEDRDQEEYVNIKFDVFATPVSVTVKSKEALENMFKSAKFLMSKYSVSKCVEIINRYVDENGILKLKAFKRSINLLKLVESSDANELTIPMTHIIEKMYGFIDKFELNKEHKVSYNHYISTIDEWTNSYIDMLGIKINTVYGFEKLKDGLVEMLSDIATKQTTKAGLRFTYNKLPEQDSTNVINRKSVDLMIQNMFNITSEALKTNNNSKIKDRHIVLTKQEF